MGLVVELALTVGEASLRGSLALVALLGFRRVLGGRTSAAARRALLLAAVLAVPALPALGSFVPGLALPLNLPLDLATVASPAGSSPTTVAGAAGAAGGAAAVLDWLAVAWLLGAMLMVTRLIVGLVRVDGRARAGEAIEDPAWLADRDRMAAALGLGRPPEMRWSRLECMPHAWGWARPVVIVPASATRWSAERRRAVLAHEIGHLARREPVARVAAELVRAVHWFDPLLRWTISGLRTESELAADEAALGLGVDPREYADSLLGLARERLAPLPAHGVPGFAAAGELERRVERILAAAPEDRPAGPARSDAAWWRATWPVLAVALVGLMAVPRLPAPDGSLGQWAERYGIPVALAAEIVAAAGEEGIDPGVAFGLVAEESAFDADRTSARGAVGLTQVLPSTARAIEPGLSDDDLRDNATNLRLGFHYLRSQIERERGNVAIGLAAYAMGPGHLDDLRERGKPVPLDYPGRVLAHLD